MAKSSSLLLPMATTIALSMIFFNVLSMWWTSPHQTVRRLRYELARRPGGNIDIFYVGRSEVTIWDEFSGLRSDAVPALVEWLEDPALPNRYLAAGQLGRVGDRRSFGPLLRALRDNDKIVRYWAVTALGDLGDRRAIDSLLDAVSSTDTRIRWLAAESLGKFTDKRVCAPLIRLLEDTEIYPRAHAAAALGKIGDGSALPALINAAEHDSDSWVRREAAESIRKLRSDVSAEPAANRRVGDFHQRT
jgi:HEAT repeat protein